MVFKDCKVQEIVSFLLIFQGGYIYEIVKSSYIAGPPLRSYLYRFKVVPTYTPLDKLCIASPYYHFQ